MKNCIKCNIEKEEIDFPKNGKYIKNICKKCIKIYSKNYRIKNKEEISIKNKKYYKDNKEEISIKNKVYYLNNKGKRRKYYRNKYNNDIMFRVKQTVSRLINYSLTSRFLTKNGDSCLNYLQYTIQELKEHLEKQFEPWMNWNNHGRYISKTWKDNDQSTWTWRIDHIIPHSTFHYNSMEDQAFKDCWALSNLCPLNAKQNHSDGVRRIRHKR